MERWQFSHFSYSRRQVFFQNGVELVACVAVMVDVGLLVARQRPLANASFAHGRKDGVQLVDGGHEFGGCCFRWLRRTKVVRLSGKEGVGDR